MSGGVLGASSGQQEWTPVASEHVSRPSLNAKRSELKEDIPLCILRPTRTLKDQCVPLIILWHRLGLTGWENRLCYETIIGA